MSRIYRARFVKDKEVAEIYINDKSLHASLELYMSEWGFQLDFIVRVDTY